MPTLVLKPAQWLVWRLFPNIACRMLDCCWFSEKKFEDSTKDVVDPEPLANVNWCAPMMLVRRGGSPSRLWWGECLVGEG